MPTDTPARILTYHKDLTWRQSLAFAGRRAGWTIVVGLACAFVWIIAVWGAPQIETLVNPVVRNTKVLPEPGRYNDPDLVAFRVSFDKVCDCASLGRSWFVVMSDSSIVRVQAQQPEADRTQTFRPAGHHIGGLQVIRLPPTRESVDDLGRKTLVFPEKIVGTTAYDRGLPWTSLVTIGPYPIADFRPKLAAAPP